MKQELKDTFQDGAIHYRIRFIAQFGPFYSEDEAKLKIQNQSFDRMTAELRHIVNEYFGKLAILESDYIVDVIPEDYYGKKKVG